jgi:hypothetical protein
MSLYRVHRWPTLYVTLLFVAVGKQDSFYFQRDLDELAGMWNTHKMASKTESSRGRRPLMMYTIPELYNADDCLCAVDEDEIDMCAEETIPKSALPCDETVKELCYLIMEEDCIDKPDDVFEARDLYLYLRRVILSEL